MSNRILSILILIGITLAFTLFYMYFFVYYTSSISINSNIGEYKLTLSSKKLKKDFSYNCTDMICNISDIAPLDYKLTIKKDNYKTILKDLNIKPKSKTSFDIFFVKETFLKKVTEEKIEETKIEKIQRIRNKKKYYSFFNLGEDLKFYFKEEGSKLNLYYSKNNKQTYLGSFDKVLKGSIDLKEIYNTDFIYLSLGKNKYLLNLVNGNKKKLDLNLGVLYAKSGKGQTNFLFVTDKGTFIYNFVNNKLEYFYLFKDYVYLNNSYIGIIYSDEEKKLKNYGFENKKNNLVIKYNPETKDRRIIYETNLKIEKIIKQGNEIFVITKEGKYKLENY